MIGWLLNQGDIYAINNTDSVIIHKLWWEAILETSLLAEVLPPGFG